jgi:hypothetical protein
MNDEYENYDVTYDEAVGDGGYQDAVDAYENAQPEWEYVPDDQGGYRTNADGELFVFDPASQEYGVLGRDGQVYDAGEDLHRAAAAAVTDLLESYPEAVNILAEEAGIDPNGPPPTVGSESGRKQSLSESVDAGLDEILHPADNEPPTTS